VLERAVPKNRGAEFLDLIEDLTNDTCVEGEPDCTRCELRKICAFALNRKTEVRSSGRQAAGRAVKEVAKTAKGKAADQPPTRTAEKKPPPKAAKETPRSGKSRVDKRRGAK
jgi:adenine-specific DNA glycosylase